MNPQYEEGDDVFRVDRIRIEDGIVVVDSGERRLEVQVLSDTSDMTLDDICFRDGNGECIPVETDMLEGARLAGKYEAVRVALEDRILSIDFGYQDPLEFYCLDGMLKYISFNGTFWIRSHSLRWKI